MISTHFLAKDCPSMGFNGKSSSLKGVKRTVPVKGQSMNSGFLSFLENRLKSRFILDSGLKWNFLSGVAIFNMPTNLRNFLYF